MCNFWWSWRQTLWPSSKHIITCRQLLTQTEVIDYNGTGNSSSIIYHTTLIQFTKPHVESSYDYANLGFTVDHKGKLCSVDPAIPALITLHNSWTSTRWTGKALSQASRSPHTCAVEDFVGAFARTLDSGSQHSHSQSMKQRILGILFRTTTRLKIKFSTAFYWEVSNMGNRSLCFITQAGSMACYVAGNDVYTCKGILGVHAKETSDKHLGGWRS